MILDYSRSKRKLWIDYAYMVMTIIYAGSASEFVYSLTSWQNPIGLAIPVIGTIFIAYVRKVSFSYAFLFLILGFLAYFILSTVKFHSFHPRFLGMYIIFFFISYVIVNAFKQRFFIMFVKIIYYLSIISLVFWGIQVASENTLRQLMEPITVTGPDQGLLNILIYTLEPVSLTSKFAIPRNPGFAWEPGVYASFLNLAIFSLLITKKFKVLGDIKFWVLSVTLLTTMSTTGYSIFLIILTFFAYNQKSKYFVALVPVIIVLGAYISTLPFMADKLMEVSEFNTDEIVYYSTKYDIEYRPQRFESLQIDLIDFLNNPILGYGGHTEERWVVKAGALINTSSGIGNLLAIFGLVGTVFFIYQMIKSSKDLSETFGYKGSYFLIIIILMISVSYALILTPFFMCFWLIRSSYLPRMELLKFKLYSYLMAVNS